MDTDEAFLLIIKQLKTRLKEFHILRTLSVNSAANSVGISYNL